MKNKGQIVISGSVSNIGGTHHDGSVEKGVVDLEGKQVNEFWCSINKCIIKGRGPMNSIELSPPIFGEDVDLVAPMHSRAWAPPSPLCMKVLSWNCRGALENFYPLTNWISLHYKKLRFKKMAVNVFTERLLGNMI